MSSFELRDLLSLEEELWRMLGSDVAPGHRRALASRIIGSPEFDKLRSFWREPSRVTLDPGVGPTASTDEGFVRVAYAGLLCRPPDENGLRHYVSTLASGGTRGGVLRSLVLSEEFERRFSVLPRTRSCVSSRTPPNGTTRSGSTSCAVSGLPTTSCRCTASPTSSPS